MTKDPVQSLLALWALILLCTVHQTAASSTSVSSQERRVHVEEFMSTGQQAHSRNDTQRRKLSVKQKGSKEQVTVTSSRATPLVPGRSSPQSWRSEELCAYRVIQSGIGGQLCFRQTLPQYKCQKEQCRTVVSFGNLVANILMNGSVLLQWTKGEESTTGNRHYNKTNGQNISEDPGTNLTTSRPVVSRPRHRRVGFELRCWWNGSYTQFECSGVQLARGCRDYLLTELHENIPYRICLQPLGRSTAGPQERDCVEFTLPPSGMQHIVIAMTTVGGAICVMLVIICLLVAYITENIMSPTSTHTYPYRTHSRH